MKATEEGEGGGGGGGMGGKGEMKGRGRAMTMAGCLLYLHRCRAMVLLFYQWIPELECCFYLGSSCLAVD